MKLENQLTNLELSKKLKELGVKQESLFYWSKQTNQKDWKCEYHMYFAIDKRQDISAFTVAELGEMLPNQIEFEGKLKWLFFIKFNLMNDEKTPVHLVRYSPFDSINQHIKETRGYTEANTRAKMLIYLLENNLTSPKGE